MMMQAKPRQESERAHVFQRRLLLLGAAKGALIAALIGRLYYLQVVQSREFSLLAEDNRINLRLSPPVRGPIEDRFGVEIAGTRRNYRLMMVAEQANDVDATLSGAARLVGLDDAQRARVEREIKRRPRFTPVMMADNLTWEQFAELNLRMPELPGVFLEAGETRDYPYGPAFAHVLGYVGPVSDEDVKAAEDDPVLLLPGFRIGKKGIEREYETQLRGEPSGSQLEVDAYGRVIRELARMEGARGETLSLTIDAALQHYAAQRMGEESAAAVVMDVHTGDLLALASSPGFDPNWFNVGISNERWRALSGSKYKPLTNKALQGQYPPGSTFKMVVALAALEEGLVTPTERIRCTGAVQLGSHTFHCWKRGGHGWMDAIASIEESCDTYYYEMARRLGPERIADMARRFGLGQRYDFGFLGERAGLLPTRAWKQETLKQAWNPGETLITGIGQGFVLATPLQLAVMTARLVNGGRAVRPRLVMNGPAEEAPSVGVRAEWLDLMVRAMNAVTEGQNGTARGSRIPIAGQEMGGKTGTSQVRRLSMRDRAMGVTNYDLPWEHRDHGLFVGYAPIHAPRFAISVIVEHGGGGSKAAAPVARDILIEAQRLDNARREGADPRVLAAQSMGNPRPDAGAFASRPAGSVPPVTEEGD